MTTLRTAVEHYAKAHGLDPEGFERAVAATIERAAAWAPAALSRTERAVLAEVGVPSGGSKKAHAHAVLTSQLALMSVRAHAEPLAEVARKLGLDSSRLRQVIAERPNGRSELFGFKRSTPSSGRMGWFVYAWQLTDDLLIARHGRRVQRVLPPAMDPVGVAAWWERPNPGCYADRREWSPREWLLRSLRRDTVDQSALAHLVEVAATEDAA